MHMLKSIFNHFIMIIVLCGLAADSFAIESSVLAERIAFIKNGAIWSSDINGQNIIRYYKTEGEIIDFRFSQDLNYLAYVAHVDKKDGIFIIKDLETEEILKKERFRIESTSIWLNHWLPTGIFYFDRIAKQTEYGSCGEPCEFDIHRKIQEECVFQERAIVDIDIGNTLKVYAINAKEEGINEIHIVDIASNNELGVVRRVGVGFDMAVPRLSHNKKYIAYISGGKDAGVWIYDMVNKSTKKIFSGGGNPVYWSIDDRHIGMFGSNDATIIELAQSRDVVKIPGRSFSWCRDGRIVFQRNMNIFVYDIRSKKEVLIIDKANAPVYIPAPSNSEASADYDKLEQVVLSGRPLNIKNVRRLSKRQLWLLRNTVFAKYGRKFENPDLVDWFSGKRWYVVNSRFDEDMLSTIDKQNVDRILNVEKNK